MAKRKWQNSEYLDDIQQSLSLNTASSSHYILWITIFFLLVFLYWANQAEIDEVTRADGRIIPSSEVQIVQNLEGGIISEILINEGQQVEQDQLLLRIDDTQFSASYDENDLRLNALRVNIERLNAEVENQEFVSHNSPPALAELYQNELALYRSRKNALASSISILNEEKTQKQQRISELSASNRALENNLKLAEEEISMKQPLVEKGVLPRVQVLDIEREISELKGKLDVNRHIIPRIRTEISEVDRRIEERQLNFRTQALAELNEKKVELARLNKAILSLEDRVKRTEVVSPVTGTVKQINVNTIGGVVQPGMDLVEIVPTDDTLVVEAEVKPSDIAFLYPGQTAVVKLTAYDFAIYGGLEATLEHISADTISNERGERFYQIRVRTTKNSLGSTEGSLPIISGMAAQVDILTGKKTIMDYLLKPINRAKEKALRER